MKRYAHLLISLPLVILPLMSVTGKPALAGVLSAAQGLELLAMTTAAASRCHALSPAESAELSRYRSRAEQAASNLLDRKRQNVAIAAGTAKGRTAPCTPALTADIRETLRAAREAVAAADGQPAPADRAQPAERPTKSPPVAMASQSAGVISLSDYSNFLNPYYAELRCHVLGRSQAVRYWRAIKRTQTVMIAKYGTVAVAGAQSSARRASSFLSCSSLPAKAANAMDKF